jgi:hypothetical protein
MRLNTLGSRERRSAAGELEQELQTHPNIDPRTRAHIQHIISSRRHANNSTPQNVLDDISREIRGVNAVLTEHGRWGGTMSPMEERAQIQSLADEVHRELSDPATPAARKAELVRQAQQLSARMDSLPKGQTGVNLWTIRHDREDLETFLREGRVTQAQYETLRGRGDWLIRVMTERLEGNLRDNADTVLAQTTVRRQEIEREITRVIESQKKLGAGGIKRYTRGLNYWGRFARQVLGGGAAAGLVGVPLAATVTTLTGGTATIPYLITHALAMGGTGVLGAAVMRYVPQMIPVLGRGSRKAARAEEAFVRRRDMLKDKELMARFEGVLRENVVRTGNATAGIARLTNEQFGGRWGQLRHALGKVLWRGSLGAVGAQVAGSITAAIKGTASITPADWTASEIGKTVSNLGEAGLNEMYQFSHTLGVAPLVEQGVSQLPPWMQWAYNGIGEGYSSIVEWIKSIEIPWGGSGPPAPTE